MKYTQSKEQLIPWDQFPLVRVAGFFILGIVIAEKINPFNDILSIVLFLMTITVISMLWFAVKNPKISSALLLLTFSAIGMIRYSIENPLLSEHHYSRYIEEGKAAVIEGEISYIKPTERSTSYYVHVNKINENASTGILLAYVLKKDSSVQYFLGDTIRFEAKIQSLPLPQNPEVFNYADYLKKKHIHYQTFIYSKKHEKLNRNPSPVSIISKVHDWCEKTLANVISNKERLAVANAMILGNRDLIDDDLQQVFTETGTVHILAVSGLHVGIVAMIFWMLFKYLPTENLLVKCLKTVLLISAVCFYALLTGGSPAVLRAAVMFSFLLVGKLWFANANVFNILALSAIVLLLYNPYLLFQVGFQLSYLALISILFFQPRLSRLYEPQNRITNTIWSLVTVSLAAQMLVFPISLYTFHQFPIYFLISGVVSVFLAPFVLGGGIITLATAKIPIISTLTTKGINYLLMAFMYSIKLVHNLPFQIIENVYLSTTSLAALYIIVIMLMFIIYIQRYDNLFQRNQYKKYKKSIHSFLLVASSILMVMNLYHSYYNGSCEVVIYKVPKSDVVDILCGTKRYTFTVNPNPKNIDFQCTPYRIKRNVVENEHQLKIGSKLNHSSVNFDGSSNLKLGKAPIVILSEDSLNTMIIDSSEIVIVCQNTLIDPYQFLLHHSTSCIVLSPNLPREQNEQWVNAASDREIELHAIKTKGFFRKEINF